MTNRFRFFIRVTNVESTKHIKYISVINVISARK